MGQQQLLLVILVTIIVGIATVVAINTFGSAADQANIDAVTNDVATLASAAQGYFMRPEMLGGGSRQFTGLTFEGLAFPANGVAADSLTAQNENGRYSIVVDNQTQFTITANPSSGQDYVPGDIDDDGVLSGGTDAVTEDQITAIVGPNDFDFN
jgi:Tfp pilus assembly protein PilE